MNRPDVSFVVPTRNSERTLEACLASLREQRDLVVEVLVIDNHSDDATITIAHRHADLVVTAGPERSAQRNLGLRHATAKVVAFIDSDMVLEPDVAREAVAHLSAPDATGVVVPEYSVGIGFLARCRALEKHLYQGDPDVEAARLFRTAEVLEVGGYDEELRAGEDWDLADRMTRSAGRVVRTASRIRHDDGHVSLRQTFSKKRYYGASFADYLDKRAADPGSRRMLRPALLRRATRSAFRHPLTAAGLVCLKTVEVSGLTLGVLEARRSQ